MAKTSPGKQWLESEDFSLFLGGPLFQLWNRSKLCDNTLERVKTRVVVLTLLAWLPLLIFFILEGNAVSGSVPIPFLFDVEAQVRFLIALPLLILAELVVHKRMRSLVQNFLDRNLIPEDEKPRFDEIL